MYFIDLFAGLGGFHVALAALGHTCVFASEIDDELRELYKRNFPDVASHTHGDIRSAKGLIPRHDVLCAGFPCQPFSKSGGQEGFRDRIRGTLFEDIVDVLDRHAPQFVLLENVGNFERHDGGRTWAVVRESLEGLGYCVRGTTHKATGGQGLLSPHHLGYPHSRGRFFIVGSRTPLEDDPFPSRRTAEETHLADIIQPDCELGEGDRDETRLTHQQNACIEHWNVFLAAIPPEVPLPSFPIWGDELTAKYPFMAKAPPACTTEELRRMLGLNGTGPYEREAVLRLLPAYAAQRGNAFPPWKQRFILQNRVWFRKVARHLPDGWHKGLAKFPPSLRKLEWNCKGEARDLWQHVLQFRPSGLRAKRMTSAPALVAMTCSQVPIIGPQKRFITRTEAKRLQHLPDEHLLPSAREAAFRALGNAVHVEVVKAIASALLDSQTPPPTSETATRTGQEVTQKELAQAWL